MIDLFWSALLVGTAVAIGVGVTVYCITAIFEGDA